MNGFFRLALQGLATLCLLLSLRGEALATAPHAVDELVLEASGTTLRAAGWFAPADPANPLAAIELVEAGSVRRTAIETVRRPDVVVALGRPELLESGWRFQIPVAVPQPSGPFTLRFLDAAGVVLAESTPVPVVRERVEALSLRHRLFAWTVVLLLLGGVLASWRRRRTVSERDPDCCATRERRGRATLAAGVVAGAALLMSAIVPPFQSPDEFDHVERAYALSKGRLLLDSDATTVSGVWTDDGLLAYMALYEHLPFDGDSRLGEATREAARDIRWAGTETFSGAPGTGYYLPIVYLPQALALALGREAGASIDASYRAARLASGSVAALLLFLAFLRWPPSLPVMALLLLPMTLFQWTGAGIDAVSIGAAVLALALWLQQEAAGTPASARRLAAVGALLVVVVGCRIHMAPLLLLPLWMARPITVPRIALGLAPLAAIAAWTLVALATTEHPNTASMSAGDKLLAYATSPGRLIDVAWTTATTPAITAFYGRSFVGVLGWLDTALPSSVYATWGILLGAALAAGLAVADWRRARPGHALVAFLGLGSAVLVPLLLLLMWTPFESPTIDGVQGRYFLLPAMALAMAIPAAREGLEGRVVVGVGSLFTILVALYTLLVTLPVLVARYYG
jgi:hypothetical protein